MNAPPDWIPTQRFVPEGLQRLIWKSLRAVAPRLAGRYLGNILRDRVRRERPAQRPAGGGPLTAVGLFDLNIGVARAANILCSAFQAAGQPVHMVDCSGLARAKTRPLPGPAEIPARGTLLFCVNPPQMAKVLRHFGPEICRGKRLVGYWWWELDRLPAGWLSWAGLMDEIWVSSRFIHENFSHELPGKIVRYVPLPIPEPVPSEATRRDFGLEPDRFTVLVAFDLASGWERKNPAGAIEAFRRAFPNAMQAQLVIKVGDADRYPELSERLQALTADMPNVRIIHQALPAGDFAALIRCSDAVLSLHRAEGLGLIVAEAMWLGTPVVATGFSGVLDMIDSESAMLVRYTPTPVRSSDYRTVTPGSTWAEPDIAAAADCLSRLAADPSMRSRLSARARSRVIAQIDPQNFAKIASAIMAPLAVGD